MIFMEVIRQWMEKVASSLSAAAKKTPKAGKTSQSATTGRQKTKPADSSKRGGGLRGFVLLAAMGVLGWWVVSPALAWGIGLGGDAAALAATAPAPTGAQLEALIALVHRKLPANTFTPEEIAVLPLRSPIPGLPLWAVLSTGHLYSKSPSPASHFLAMYSYGPQGWREVAWVDFEGLEGEDYFPPEILDAEWVRQVDIEPSRVWLTVEGGAGAHSGLFYVFSCDGQQLRLELAWGADSPTAGFVEDVNGDGRPDIVLDGTQHYVFCYACGVYYPAFRVFTWQGEGLVEVELAPLGQEHDKTPAGQAVREALALVKAGLWGEARKEIGKALALADSLPPREAQRLRWMWFLVRFHHRAHLEAVSQSEYPLLSQVFVGDFDAAVNSMRAYPVEDILTFAPPLVKGTVAEGWEDALSEYLVEAADRALALRPNLAAAYFIRAWARLLAEPLHPQIAADLAEAAQRAPKDPLFAEALAWFSRVLGR